MEGARIFRFGDFSLDRREQLLTGPDGPIALAPRYFDALALLAANPGALMTKDRLFEEVWSDVTVGDEALTQCIKDLRKALGDDAGNPRFIETLPKRGYRFIAPIETSAPSATGSSSHPVRGALVLGAMLGGGAAGLLGGIAYGLVAGMGNDAALAILLVMASLTAGLAALGALALGLGMAAASRIVGQPWLFSIAGAGLAGFLVGEVFHLFAASGFSLFVGRAHDEFTGGLEGLLLGASIAAGARFAGGIDGRWPRPVLGGSLGGMLAGIAIALLGGKLMAASLAALARNFHGSALELGMFGKLSGEEGFGLLAQAMIAGGEGLLFGAGLVAGILIAARRTQHNLTTGSPLAHSF